MRPIRLLAPAALAAALAGCVDEPVSTLAPGNARIVFASEFSFASQTAGLPIEIIQATSVMAGDTVGFNRNSGIEPDDESFSIDAIVDLGGQDSGFVHVDIELLSTASGEEVVEWSGRVGPIMVHADEETTEQSDVALIRGPIENLGVQSIDVFGPPSMVLNTVHPVFAEVVTSGSSHQVVWSSSDPSIIDIEDPVGDSIDINAVGLGEAWVIGAAGMAADSFLVSVSFTGGGPVAMIMALPDSAVMVPGSTRQWQAFALDENEFPTFPTFTWTSLDQSIASVSSTGLVSAHELGRARIVVSAEGFADTAIVNVQTLPAGVTIMWQGGTFGAEDDWFTADNWSPARVPTATDIVYMPGSSFVTLDGNTAIGGFLGDSLIGYTFSMVGSSTLTIHGDMVAALIFGDSTSMVVLDGAGAEVWGYTPNLSILADVTLVGDLVSFGSLAMTAAHLDIGSEYALFVQNDMSASASSVTLSRNDTTFSDGAIYVGGDLSIDGGDWSSGITAGWIEVQGDLTVSAVCGSFAPQGGAVEMVSDTATISIGCAGLTQNYFNDLWVYGSTLPDRVLELQSDVFVMGEFYHDQGTVIGNGHTLRARYGSAYSTTFDHTFVEVVNVSPDDYFSTDSIVFTGMTGETRPQVRFFDTGSGCFGCYGPVDVYFDPTSAGPYIEVVDTEADGDSLRLYMMNNPGDGPQRTVTSGEAVVHWADVPVHLIYWSGSGQSGTQHQPLPDSLVAEVVDYAFYGVEGVAVEWAVTQGDGSVSPALSLTDSLGLASTQWTVGDTIFFSQEVIATTDVLPQDTIFYQAFPMPVAPAGVAAQAPANVVPAMPTESAQPARRVRREPTAMPARPVPARIDTPTTERER